MRHPLRDSRAVFALILPAFCAAPPASAEIFKCVAKDGTALYQNFPCQFDSIGWMPSNPQAAKTTSMLSAASQAKPKAAPVSVASTVKATDARETRIGMAPDEVRAILGEPLEIVQDTPVEGIEMWRYVDRTVQFDRAQRVVTVESW
ncbi:MAG TPA: DUF4124 domain-containing protein [Casimicrobiaceae bacterium]|nr:DUF4124 domain-containing protein [Casimicrobiaceae bacterium]